LHDVVDVINVAWQCSSCVDDLLRAAKDPDGYRDQVNAFLVSVDNAKKAVESGLATLEKAKRERAERQRIDTLISEIVGRLADALGSIKEADIECDPSQELGRFSISLRRLVEETAKHWQSGQDREVADWRADIEDWGRRVEASMLELNTHREKSQAERRSNFAARIALFGETPPRTLRTPIKELVGKSEVRAGAGAKISSEGLSEHSDKLLQIESLIGDLQRAGADRGGVQSCLNHFVTSAYRIGSSGASVSSFASRVRTNTAPSTPVK